MKIIEILNERLVPSEIRKMISKYIHEYDDVSSAWDINNGLCLDFANELNEKFPWLQVFEMANFKQPAEDINEYFDVELLKQHWPQIQKPNDFSWEELQAVEMDDHIWIYDPRSNLHYDAETPNGVHNIFDLEFMKRQLNQFRRERKTTNFNHGYLDAKNNIEYDDSKGYLWVAGWRTYHIINNRRTK